MFQLAGSSSLPSLPTPLQALADDTPKACSAQGDARPSAEMPRQKRRHNSSAVVNAVPSFHLNGHSPGKLRSAALLARGRDWFSSKTDQVLQINSVSALTQSWPISPQRRKPQKPLEKEKLARESADMSDLRLSLNLPEDIMSQARSLFERHAETKPGSNGFLADRRLTEAGFAKAWSEMTGQDDEEDARVPLQIVTEAFRHAGASQELEFAQFATWFSSRCFSEDVSLDKESKDLRRIARKHAIHHSEVESYKRMFNKFDKDGSGTIDSREFAELLCTCIKAPASIGLPANRVQNLWQIADQDGDHEISFEEFLDFYTKYLRTESTAFEDFYRCGGLSRQTTTTLGSNAPKW
jgi:Ca2+-binding EF-hand superfamily protein